MDLALTGKVAIVTGSSDGVELRGGRARWRGRGAIGLVR